MILKRIYDDRLAQASYLVGCAATGEALIVDPNREIEQYLDAAEAEGLRITHVTETHIHADFVSGSRELAQRTGARLYLSAEGGPDWSYAFADESNATLLRNGDHFQVGNVRIEAIHTPGHTPEHLSFLVTDRAASSEPMAVLTGDFVFVGDVGRPDLLEKAAGVAGTMKEGAAVLFRSLQRFMELPDYLQIYPGHGAGSACGKGIGSLPSTTIGYEKLYNWAFQIEDEAEFVEAVLAGQPEPPKYFAQMKRINREGPATRGEVAAIHRLADSALRGILQDDGFVIDTRSAEDYAAGHVPGTLNIPLNKSFSTWAGWLAPYDQDLYLIVGPRCDDCLTHAVDDLSMIGLDRIAGYFDTNVFESWKRSSGEMETVEKVDAEDVRDAAGQDRVSVIDVRGATEYEAGHIPGAINMPLGLIPDRLSQIPDGPLVVHCQTGGRSAIAASLLESEGFQDVRDFSAGYAGWEKAKLPTTRGEAGDDADLASTSVS